MDNGGSCDFPKLADLIPPGRPAGARRSGKQLQIRTSHESLYPLIYAVRLAGVLATGFYNALANIGREALASTPT